MAHNARLGIYTSFHRVKQSEIGTVHGRAHQIKLGMALVAGLRCMTLRARISVDLRLSAVTLSPGNKMTRGLEDLSARMARLT